MLILFRTFAIQIVLTYQKKLLFNLINHYYEEIFYFDLHDAN